MAGVPGAEIYPVTDDDIRELSSHLRPADSDEVFAATGETDVEATLRRGIALTSGAWSLRLNGELAGIWGVAAGREGVITGKTGYGWLLTTPVVERRPKTFWRVCLEVLPLVMEEWDELVNAIDARNVQALRWARRLGFRLEEAKPFGALGLPFHVYRVRKEDLRCLKKH